MKRNRHSRCLYLAALLVPLLAAAQTVSDPAQVRISTTPTGATVLCDGELCNASPTTINDLAAGEHLIIIRQQGYREERRTLNVKAGQRVALDLKLEPVRGLVLIDSTPPGAEVQVGGAVAGTTPLLLTELALGRYRLRIGSQGYQPKELDLDIENRTPRKETVALTSDTATLTLDSTPGGATVILDGINRGTTPCTIDRIPEGTSVLELLLYGYQTFREEVRMRAGDSHEMTVPLKMRPAELKVVTIPQGARIYVNNQFRGTSPVTLEELEPGSYRVRAELPAYAHLARTIVLKRGTRIVEEFRLEGNVGQLQISTQPAGVKIFVDGEEAGITKSTTESDQISDQLTLESVLIGTRTFVLSKKGYHSRKFTLDIEKNKTITLHQKLKRRFVPNYEVRTEEHLHRGVLIGIDEKGNIRLEKGSFGGGGVKITILAEDIVSHGPIREDPPEPDE